MLFYITEDIDVPEAGAEVESDAPPMYEEIQSQEGVTTSTGAAAPPDSKPGKGVSMLGKPLRSIMKKSSDRSKEKKEKLDIKKRDSVDTHSPKSPKHSVSMSAGLGALYNNGDVADPSMVSVQVVRSSSRTMVDSFEMKEGKKSATMSTITSSGQIGHARTSSSMPEEGYTDEELDGDLANHKPLLPQASNSKDVRSAMNGEESGESNCTLNTQL